MMKSRISEKRRAMPNRLFRTSPRTSSRSTAPKRISQTPSPSSSVCKCSVNSVVTMSMIVSLSVGRGSAESDGCKTAVQGSRHAAPGALHSNVILILCAQAVNELSGHFKTFRNIKQILDLLNAILAIQADLKRMIFSDFEGRQVLNN
jgi:hypothetical protein